MKKFPAQLKWRKGSIVKIYLWRRLEYVQIKSVQQVVDNPINTSGTGEKEEPLNVDWMLETSHEIILSVCFLWTSPAAAP